jgi:hypothetical protein
VSHCTWLILNLLGNSTLFSKMSAPLYTPTNRVPGCHLLHLLTNACYFLFFW